MKKFYGPGLICVCILLLTAACTGLYRTGRHNGQKRPANKGNTTANRSDPALIFKPSAKIPADFNGKITKGISYGSNVDYQGKRVDLKMDILEPNNGNSGKFPLFVFIHGGGFLVGGRAGAGNFRASLAEQGFVVASIDYRLGWSRADDRSGCSGDSLELKYAIYRALQDLNASLRYLVAHADEYRIDTRWIFVGGQSAGGVTSLNAAFLSQQEAEADVPGITQKLGPLNSAGNNLTNTFDIKAVAAMWGDMHSPAQVSKADAVPVIFFHGEQDRVAPMDEGNVYFCPNFMYVYGAKPLYERLKELNVSTVAYIDPQGGHGVFSDGFRTSTITCFLKDIMNGKKVQGYYVGATNTCP